MKSNRTLRLAAGLGLLVASAQMSSAAEVTVFAARALATVLQEAGAEFERTSGYKLNIISGLSREFVARINAGEAFDAVITAREPLDGMIRSGRVLADTRIELARSGIGILVKAGAPKPDISSVEAFKRALLEAKSIGYLNNVGGSGAYLAPLLERLGIAAAIASKVTRPDTDIVSELVAKGEIELGMVVITQIMTTPGVELVGPLPADIQSYVVFAGGVSANAAARDAATALMKFLHGPIAVPVIRAQGMEPCLPDVRC